MPEKLGSQNSAQESFTELYGELSPEIIEKIMGKVKDINEKGLAYSGISRTFDLENSQEDMGISVASVLKDGFLGTPGGRESKIEAFRNRHVTQDYYRQNTYFNINGRCKNLYLQETNDFPVLEKNKPQVYYGRYSSNRINIVFDISFLEEVGEDFYLKYLKDQKSVGLSGLKMGHYMLTPSPEDPNILMDDLKNKKETQSYSAGTGFVTRSRIKPKYLLGVIIPAMKKTAEIKDAEGRELYEIDSSEYAHQRRGKYVDAVKKIMLGLYQENPAMILPIYDAEGNVLWPKQMSWEEVKKFVEKRYNLNQKQHQ
ncbi:MAG: hypothetical protein A3D44_01685 [Candidatus Staskawiczbacteria bacterium RIFCSPHIGHO2_02_FULL_42_22]|uniref:Uncharacterized protein n=1 Tax=Candidatus Staskawiczbacteria bacterium RIFCSPHIGHO2_02_FULL_42_22 TaxID=1802207 RepID=A0A1G2I1R0_9BACT|nr:MAG: hypothetical protein A3D44_01685 [Candidatus Staskawiczbacteria bacterium RIFCSPHIGHO2_02_FULL_42_22]